MLDDIEDTATDDEVEKEDNGDKIPSRDKDYSQLTSMREDLSELYNDVIKAFNDKNSRAQDNRDYWDIYNCVLTNNQGYSGTSQTYVPVVHDAIEARVMRFTNALFPANGRHVEVITHGAPIPHGTMSLLEHYVRSAGLRELTPALLRNGDIEGHYSIYLEWEETKRTITKRVKKTVEVEDGIELPGDEYETVEDEEITDRTPRVMVVADSDIAILPATAASPEEAEVVAIAVRLSKEAVKARMKKGDFDKETAKKLLDNFGTAENPQQPNPAKDKADAAGVKLDGGSKHALLYMVWTKRLKLGKHTGWSVSWHAGADACLSLRRNPNWCDRVPVLSAPLKRLGGSFWGQSPVATVAQTQYAANDAINMGLDSAQYALMPIFMTDPEKNPRTGSMVLNMAAIWMVDPNSSKFAEFPPLWKEAFELVAALKNQVMQSLSVNPSMMPAGARKATQAQAAQEQAAAVEATADAVTILEESIFTPMLRWFFEMDHQHREEPMLVRQFGDVGIKATIEEVPPVTMDTTYVFRWYGVEMTKQGQQIQQMIAAMNVLRGIPPELLGGLTLNLAPVAEDIAEKVFGPRLAPKVLIDQRDQMTIDPAIENLMLQVNHPAEVHPGDDDPKHMQSHLMAAMQTAQAGMPIVAFREHIEKHQKQMAAKAQAAAPPQGPPGGPPGMAAPPGQPRIGAQPGMPRGGQQPPGAIHPDQMQDPGRVPQ